MTRAEIEARLGPEADSSELTEDGTTVRYYFDRGYHPPAHDNPLWWPLAAAGWEAMNLGSLGTRSYWERQCQRALLELRYDPAGQLVGAGAQLSDLGWLNRGAQEICDRIRSHLRPATLDIKSKQ